MKKLMILGASYSQLPLYEAAERLGIKTIAARTPGDWPGFQAADESTYTDISDPGAVMEAARKFQADPVMLPAGYRKSSNGVCLRKTWAERTVRKVG